MDLPVLPVKFTFLLTTRCEILDDRVIEHANPTADIFSLANLLQQPQQMKRGPMMHVKPTKCAFLNIMLLVNIMTLLLHILLKYVEFRWQSTENQAELVILLAYVDQS
jgi:hypothetical protein